MVTSKTGRHESETLCCIFGINLTSVDKYWQHIKIINVPETVLQYWRTACFRNIDYFHFTTSGTSFLRQTNIPRPMISRGPFTTPTTTPNHYYLPSKSTYLQNNTFLPFCNCLCIIEGIGIGLSKMTENWNNISDEGLLQINFTWTETIVAIE